MAVQIRPPIRLLRANKNAGQVYPARRQVVNKPILLRAEADLAAYELNQAQTDTQQGDGRAAVRNCSHIRGKTQNRMIAARILDAKSPRARGWIKTATAYDAGASDVKER
jgi:hypothetical protein